MIDNKKKEQMVNQISLDIDDRAFSMVTTIIWGNLWQQLFIYFNPIVL
jgi:hypothetical protein